MTTEYPQDAAPVKNRRSLKIAAISLAAILALTGGMWGTVAFANGVTATQHAQAVAFQHSVDQAMPQLQANTSAAAAEANTASADQAVAIEQAAIAARAAAALAAQQAAQAAAKAAGQHHSTSTVNNSSGLPAGAVPPNVPGTNQPDSTACASSTLVWNGTQSVCG